MLACSPDIRLGRKVASQRHGFPELSSEFRPPICRPLIYFEMLAWPPSSRASSFILRVVSCIELSRAETRLALHTSVRLR